MPGVNLTAEELCALGRHNFHLVGHRIHEKDGDRHTCDTQWVCAWCGDAKEIHLTNGDVWE